MADAPADLEIRPLRPGDDPDAQLDLSERTFGPGSAADRDRQVLSLSRLIAGGRYLGAFAGGRPAAGAAFQDMRQWWHGRPVPMAGVSSVKVAPEYRGRGIGRLLMTAFAPRPTCSTCFDGHAAGVALRTARGPVSSTRTDVRGPGPAEADGEHLVGLSYARHPIRVLGVDPGLTRCGVGVVEGAPGRALTLIRVGVIRTSADADIAARLLAIETEIEAWLDACRPDAVAVERVFSQQNVRTVMGTAQAGAIAIACAARRGLPVALHTPSEVKAAVTGNGRADKAQVTNMVTRLLRVSDPPRPADAADALALAICHIWRGGGAGLRLAALTGRGGSAS